jgi:hypothetical protein
MKLKALRKAHYVDNVRGTWPALKVGEEFSLDPKEDAQQIWELIASKAAICSDPQYIPESAKYLCLRSFRYRDSDGREKDVGPQQIVTLGREDACRCMSSGQCRPVDLTAWTPAKLLKPTDVPTGKPKVMFDEIEPGPVSTREIVRDHKVRGAL